VCKDFIVYCIFLIFILFYTVKLCTFVYQRLVPRAVVFVTHLRIHEINVCMCV
jgi:hypothetical protein